MTADLARTLAQQIGAALLEQGKSLAVAESCTGGLLGAAITDVPGSSRYFLGGVIAYSNQVKMAQLGVPEETLATRGAVSGEAAAAMAEGVRRLLQASIGLAITGVAGPGAEAAKPAGLTYIGLAALEVSSRRFQWTGDRWQNRQQSVLAALEWLANELTKSLR